MLTLDVRHIIATAGGPQALLATLQRHSDEVPAYNTVQMWGHRNAIPARWIGLVLYAMCQPPHNLTIPEMVHDDTELLA